MCMYNFLHCHEKAECLSLGLEQTGSQSFFEREIFLALNNQHRILRISEARR